MKDSTNNISLLLAALFAPSNLWQIDFLKIVETTFGGIKLSGSQLLTNGISNTKLL
jgi:hypothetical protein